VLGDLELSAKYLPRRPSMLPKLMSAINSDSNSMREMAKIISEDGTLLGGLLKLANSSFYRKSGTKRIDSLEKAVALVGTDGLRSLAATALLHPVMTGKRGPYSSFAEAIWEHGELSAACAELHAARVERADAFSARLLVLLVGLASNAVFRIVREHSLSEAGVRPAAVAKPARLACRLVSSPGRQAGTDAADQSSGLRDPRFAVITRFRGHRQDNSNKICNTFIQEFFWQGHVPDFRHPWITHRSNIL
jgi:hypothetical protein